MIKLILIIAFFIVCIILSLIYSVCGLVYAIGIFLTGAPIIFYVLVPMIFITSILAVLLAIRERGFSLDRWRDFFCNAKYRRILSGDPSYDIKVDVIYMLIGTSSRSDVLALKRALRDKNPPVVLAVRDTLAKVQGSVAKDEAACLLVKINSDLLQ